MFEVNWEEDVESEEDDSYEGCYRKKIQELKMKKKSDMKNKSDKKLNE